MTQPGQDRPSRRRARPGSRRVAWALLAPLPLAVLLLGGVHPLPRAGLAAVAVALAAAALITARPERVGPPAMRLLFAPAVAAALLGGLSLVPVGPGLRAALQPGLAAPLDAMLVLVGQDAHPLALDPHRARTAWGQAAAMVLLALATALVVHQRTRRIRLATGVVATALGVLVIGGLHRVVGATEIYGFTGLPVGSRYPFFAPFVSHNHAGALFAAAAPLAAALALRQHVQWRVGAGAATALLVVGAVWSESRGALVGLGVGLGVLAALAGGRKVAALVGVSGLVVAVTSLTGGLRHAATVFSETFVPGSVDQDVFGNRLTLWRESVDLIVAAPLTGVGPGGFRDGYKLVKDNPLFVLSDHAHQEPLQALGEYGVVAGTLWVVAALVPVGAGLRRGLGLPPGRRRTLLAGWLGCALALLVGTLYDFPLRIGALAVLLALALGVLAAAGGAAEPHGTRRGRRLVQAGAASLAVVASLGVVVPALDLLAPGHPWGANGPLHAQSAADWDAAREAARAGASPEAQLGAIRERASRALARRPLDQEAAVWLARARLASEDVAGARAVALALTDAYPTLPAGWLLLAEIQRHAGDLDASRAAWRAGLALELPDLDDALPAITRALSLEADPAGAAEALLPDRADRLRDGAAVLARAGERTVSQRLFERAVALDRGAGVSYGNWLLLWDEPARAWAVLRRVPEPGCRGQLLAGEAALRAGEEADATERFRAALAACASESDDDVARLGLARARLAGGEASALSALERSLDADPTQHRLRREVLAALRRRGRSKAMVPHLEALVLEGRATAAEIEDLRRIYRGLPPR